jgi:hypothetical protein
MKAVALTFLEQVRQSRHCVWLRVFLQLTAFGLAIISPSIWLKSRIRPSENQFFLNARREIKNYRFIPVSLGSLVEKSLSTTEIFNGHFIDARSQRISVFVGNWKTGRGDLNSLGHTPEKCWVRTGFQIVPYSGPSQLGILFGRRQIPFQCRILKHSDLGAPEITLWAVCIDGIWDGIPYEPPLEKIKDDYTVLEQFQNALILCKWRWEFFYDRILLRSNPAARKQFIRFSTPIITEWQPALDELVAFANRWLEPY